MTLTLEQLLARQEIVDVCTSYALALDTCDWVRLRSLFVPGAVAEYGAALGRNEGYDAIEATCRGALEPLKASQHLMGNHLVLFTADGADATCYFQATHVDHRGPGMDTFTVAGRYDDRMVLTDSGWRIAHKTLTTMWVSGDPAVLGGAGPSAPSRS